MGRDVAKARRTRFARPDERKQYGTIVRHTARDSWIIATTRRRRSGSTRGTVSIAPTPSPSSTSPVLSDDQPGEIFRSFNGQRVFFAATTRTKNCLVGGTMSRKFRARTRRVVRSAVRKPRRESRTFAAVWNATEILYRRNYEVYDLPAKRRGL